MPAVGRREAQLIEARLEAAFDRFNRAAMAGVDPTPASFITSLEAEGLRLNLATETATVPFPDRRSPANAARAGSISFGRRAGDVIGRRVRGLP